MAALPEFPPAKGSHPLAGGLVPLPSFPPAAAPQVDRPAAAGPATAPAAAPNPGCTPGPPMEPRDYAQAEYIGRPEGRVARMCFFRSDGRSATESLNFFANGHVVMSSSNAATGPGGGVSVLGTMRGTYGFQEGRLATRMAYAGMGVSQSARSSGSERSLDASGQQRLEQAKVLPNCQRVFLRDAVHSLELPPSQAHPPYLVIDGVRWEQMRIDCPAWQGWR